MSVDNSRFNNELDTWMLPFPWEESKKGRNTQGVGGRGKPGLGLMGLGQTGHEAELASIRQYGYENYAAQAEIDMMMLKEAERSS